MRGGRRSRIRKSVSAAPTRRRVRSAPKPKSPTRRVSAPTIPADIMKQIQERIQSLPKKAPAKKTKPAAPKKAAAPKKTAARKLPTAPKVPESIKKRIEDAISARAVGSKPKRTPAQRPKPVARRRPAVQPVRKKPAVKKPVARKKTREISAELRPELCRYLSLERKRLR